MNSVLDTRDIPIQDIVIATRLRKHPEQIEQLAEDIVDHGLINPITVMNDGNGKHTLIAGLRRLEAMRFLGVDDIRATVLSPMDAGEMLAMEYAENEQRQDFTVSERLEYAEKIKAVEKAKARERMAAFAREDRRKDQGRLVRSYPERGKAREIIAKQAGFSSGIQYERAAAVATKRPDLLDKIDSGKTTIYGAYKEVVAPACDTTACDTAPDTEGDEHHPLAPTLPNDQVARAKHERLMKNPLYAELHQKYTEAVKATNTAKGELRFQVECMQKVIRGHEENIRALIRERDELRAENRELWHQLDPSHKETGQPSID